MEENKNTAPEPAAETAKPAEDQNQCCGENAQCDTPAPTQENESKAGDSAPAQS